MWVHRAVMPVCFNALYSKFSLSDLCIPANRTNHGVALIQDQKEASMAIDKKPTCFVLYEVSRIKGSVFKNS